MTRLTRRALIGAALLCTFTLCLLGSGPAAAAAPPITEFTSGLLTNPSDLQPGPDGNLWFVDSGAIGRVTPTGTITEFTAGLPAGSMPHAIAAGGDGNLWFTDPPNHAIGRITPTGTITEFPLPHPASIPYELTAAADGTLWFTDPGVEAIGEIDPATVATAIPEYSVLGVDPVPNLDEITEGPDGNAYVTDKGNDPGIIAVTPGGTVTESLTSPGSTMPSGIGPGDDGDVWFTDQGVIGRTTPAGVSATFTLGLQAGSEPDAIVAGPDGNEWFDDQYSAQNAVGRVTPSGQITEFDLSATPWDITAGIDGDLWLPVGNAMDRPSQGVVRVSSSGAMTTVAAGLAPGAQFGDGTNIVSGPDGNLWTIDNMGSPVGIDRVDVELPPTTTTGAVSAITQTSGAVTGAVNGRGSAATVTIQYGTTSALGTTAASGTVAADNLDSPTSATLTGLAAGTQYFYRVAATNAYGTVTGSTQSFTTAAAPVTTGTGGGTGGGGGGATTTGPAPTATRVLTTRIGNQAITVSLAADAAGGCVAGSSSLPVTVQSTTAAGSLGAKVRLRTVAVFLDRGVRHVRRVRLGNRVKKVIVYRPNATARHLPAVLAVPLHGITAGTHRLRVTLTFAQPVSRRAHTHTAQVIRTLKTTIRVC